MGKKCWQIQLNGKNQPNHRSEPAEPLDSPHESPISKRKVCSRRRPSTRTFVWIFANMRHFFFAPRPRAFTKIAIFVLQNVPNHLSFFASAQAYVGLLRSPSSRSRCPSAWKAPASATLGQLAKKVPRRQQGTRTSSCPQAKIFPSPATTTQGLAFCGTPFSWQAFKPTEFEQKDTKKKG